MKRPKKGDRLRYVGGYDPACTARYSPGTVVGFHYDRWHGPSVTVLLDDKHTDGTDLFADWPIKQCEPDE